jgi:hypothetical protein
MTSIDWSNVRMSAMLTAEGSLSGRLNFDDPPSNSRRLFRVFLSQSQRALKCPKEFDLKSKFKCRDLDCSRGCDGHTNPLHWLDYLEGTETILKVSGRAECKTSAIELLAQYKCQRNGSGDVAVQRKLIRHPGSEFFRKYRWTFLTLGSKIFLTSVFQMLSFFECTLWGLAVGQGRAEERKLNPLRSKRDARGILYPS